MDDLISREAAIYAIDKIFPFDPMRNDYTQGITCGAALAKEYIKQLPSAHPELDEWCTDCKEYDHERHCCPRYNRVIRESLAEIADERLVPKKPYTYYSNPPYKTLLARCPNCKRPLRPGRTYRNPDLYCPRCGQAIDWSEEK